MNLVPTCVICGEAICETESVCLCEKCRHHSDYSEIYLAAIKKVILMKSGFTLTQIKKGFNSSVYLKSNLCDKKQLVRFKKTFSKDEDLLEKEIHESFLNNRLFYLEGEAKKYFKKVYKNVSNYKKKHFLKPSKKEIEEKLISIYNFYGRDFTLKEIEPLDKKLYHYFKKVSRYSEKSLSSEKKRIPFFKDKCILFCEENLVDKAMQIAKKKEGPFRLKDIAKNNTVFYGKKVYQLTGQKAKTFEKMINKAITRQRNRDIHGIKIEDHYNLIRKVIVKKFDKYCRNHAHMKDAESAGVDGLMSAVGLYNPNIASWSTYAWGWIDSAIKRFFENNDVDSLIKIPSHRHYDKNFNKAEYRTASLQTKIGDEENSELLDIVEDKKNFEEDIFLRQIDEDLENTFDKKCALAFKEHYMGGKKFKHKKYSIEEVINYLKKKHFADRM